MAYLRMTVAEEGGQFSAVRDPTAPIRIYADRWIEDDIAQQFTGIVRRVRLSRKAFRLARRAARQKGRS